MIVKTSSDSPRGSTLPSAVPLAPCNFYLSRPTLPPISPKIWSQPLAVDLRLTTDPEPPRDLSALPHAERARALARLSRWRQKCAQTVARQKRAAQLKFLRAFARHGVLIDACKETNTAYSRVQGWKQSDGLFAGEYRRLAEIAIHVAEAELKRRAIDGWNEPVYQGGELVGHVRRFSDQLLVTYIRRLAPDLYAPRREALTNVNVGVTMVPLERLSDEELAVYRRILEKGAPARPQLGSGPVIDAEKA